MKRVKLPKVTKQEILVVKVGSGSKYHRRKNDTSKNIVDL